MKRRHLLALPAFALVAPWLRVAAAAAQTGTPPAFELVGSWRAGLHLGEWWVSEKYDGIRAWWDGQHLITRGGRRLAAPAWFTQGWPGAPLDGELWAGHGCFAQVQSAVLRQQPDDAAWRAIRFMVFDLPTHGGNFDARLQALRALPAAPTLHIAEQRRVASDAQLRQLLASTTHAGGEGLVLHHGAALYQSGRSANLLKLKPFEDAEARVIAHLPGKGRNAGRLGALLVETPEGQRFRIGSGFTDAQRHAPPPVGTWVAYRYRGHHASGLPRFASFLRACPAAPGEL